MNQLPAQPNRSLIDGLALLQELARRGEPVAGVVLARELGMEKTRVNRLLKTLGYLGFAQRTAHRRYVCGDGIHVLAAQSLYGSGLLRCAMPHLEALHGLRLVVALGVLWQNKVSYLYHHRPDQQTAIEGLGGNGAFPLGLSSVGMAILAARSDMEVEALAAAGPVDGFRGDDGEIRREIARIRRRGYADIVTDHRSMAVTVGDPAFAAVALAGDIPDDRVPGCLQQLQTAARNIAADLHAFRAEKT
jgi:DNA-binding IclR family transcriptional regulator